MIDAQLQWTRASLMDEATNYLKALNIDDPARNVEWILCELLKCDRASLYAYPELTLPKEILVQFQQMFERRKAHEPLQYILGYTEFCGLRFDLTPDVLIPRSETELLIEHATDFLRSKNTPSVLDIGSGSGCIPVTIKHFNNHAEVFSCDVSRPALEIARSNAAQAGTPVSFFYCDILKETLPLPKSHQFDLIVSNPPYIPEAEYETLDPEVLNFEPQMALNAGKDPLLFYRAIGHIAAERLCPGGVILFETHCDFAHKVASLLRSLEFSNVRVLCDLSGLSRFVEAVWLVR